MRRWFDRLPFRKTTAQADPPAAKAARRVQAAAPALVLATGLGVGFWWWSQWARGRTDGQAGGSRPGGNEASPQD